MLYLPRFSVPAHVDSILNEFEKAAENAKDDRTKLREIFTSAFDQGVLKEVKRKMALLALLFATSLLSTLCISSCQCF